MTSEATFEVLDPGLLTTIQDAGRPNLGHLGVPRAGACDPTALAVANLLVGNRPDAPVLECTIAGPDLRVIRDVVVGIAGADLGAVSAPSGRRLGSWAAHLVQTGERLILAGTEPAADAGARAYLAVPGGFAVPTILGSASTSLVGGFGGIEGRLLRAGDELTATGPIPDHRRLAGHRWPADLALTRAADTVAILAGPAAGTTAGAEALEALIATAWGVASASDRRGLRLEGPPLQLDAPSDGPSHGVPLGTIQVTPSGLPIVLLQDAGPTGGYPVLAVVATSDRSIVGQARPGGQIAFRLVDQEGARTAERERRRLLAAGAARLGMTDPWDDLPDLAGA
jgi:biotin-dependent carboxylase-like uncharacterized protein